MSHKIDDLFHNVIDDDGIFTIDPRTKEITYEQAGDVDYFGGPVLVKGEHKSERLTFKIPKVIEGHDMSTCNLIRIHYITLDANTSSQYRDAYDVPASDRIVSEGSYLTFSWLIDRYVTQAAGPISFAIQFACTQETSVTETTTDADSGDETTVEKKVLTVEYSWSTLPYTELRVAEGINNDKKPDEPFIDEFNSILSGWYDEISSAIVNSNASNIKSITQTTTSTEDQGINVVTVTFGDDTTTEFVVQNGSTGTTGSDGLSAYQVALNNGFEGSEEDWLNSLKAIGYDDCLKGVTLTQAEYDSLSEAEKNREDFVYIIKSEKLHADTATSADIATSAAGYTEDGAIATAISEINKALDDKASSDHIHDEYASTDHIHDEYASAEAISETGSVSVTYTCSTNNGDSNNSSIVDPIIIYVGNDDGEDTVTHTFTIKNNNDFTVICDWEAGDYGEGNRVTIAANSSNTFAASSNFSNCNIKAQFIYGDITSNVISREFNGVANFEVNANPVTVDIADGLVCVHAEITSCSLTGATYNVMVSSDGKKLTFTLSGYTSEYTSGGSHTATIDYTYTTTRPAYRSKWTDHLMLRSAMYTFDGSNPVSVTASPNRAYIVSIHIEDVTGVPRSYTGVIYIPEDGAPNNTGEASRAYSSVMGLEHVQPYQLRITRNGNTGKYYAVILKPDVDSVMASDIYVACTFTLIEL